MVFYFVEGFEDKMFLNKILNCNEDNTYEFERKKPELIDFKIKSRRKSGDKIILMLKDRDKKHNDKDVIDFCKKIYKSIRDEEIFVVVLEIESWYCAGVTNEQLAGIGIKPVEYNTELVAKENLVYKKDNKEISTQSKAEMLKYFDKKLACKRNNSFNRFIEKINAFN